MKQVDKKNMPDTIDAVYLHDGEFMITYLMGAITLAYKPMMVRKSKWPAIAFSNPQQCREIANELLKTADYIEKFEKKKAEAKALLESKRAVLTPQVLQDAIDMVSASMGKGV